MKSVIRSTRRRRKYDKTVPTGRPMPTPTSFRADRMTIEQITYIRKSLLNCGISYAIAWCVGRAHAQLLAEASSKSA